MKKLLLVAVAVIGFAALAHARGEVAADCHYTGYSGDTCHTSSGGTNYAVLNCEQVAEGDCGYN